MFFLAPFVRPREGSGHGAEPPTLKRSHRFSDGESFQRFSARFAEPASFSIVSIGVFGSCPFLEAGRLAVGRPCSHVPQFAPVACNTLQYMKVSYLLLALFFPRFFFFWPAVRWSACCQPDALQAVPGEQGGGEDQGGRRPRAGELSRGGGPADEQEEEEALPQLLRERVRGACLLAYYWLLVL